MTRPKIRDGIYPTMLTPYTQRGEVDEKALRSLTEWYEKKGCQGIFAACQSSEIFFLSLEERRRITEITAQEAASIAAESGREKMTVVASGHVSDDPGEQAEELTAMWESGADVAVLISNRLDIEKKGEKQWIEELEALLRRLPGEIPLGIYECPTPYKRLISEKMLKEIRDTGRFCFFKDTCCDPELLTKRLKLLEGSSLKLFNANAQTLLYTLQGGGAGYCGIMANFHPELYIWLKENWMREKERADRLENILSMAAFSEVLPYPATAKYYLKEYEGLPMNAFSRSCRQRELKAYDRLVMGQLERLSGDIKCRLMKGEES
ncbi:MAG: dihydrodipicolinate synthase family protein [Eubacteriales bacterium]|nr:dihydrodipicolinate synthase family protein [Eubacteriales bacterium]